MIEWKEMERNGKKKWGIENVNLDIELEYKCKGNEKEGKKSVLNFRMYDIYFFVQKQKVVEEPVMLIELLTHQDLTYALEKLSQPKR